MHKAFEHPDPEWTPVVKYGDPVPMKWVQVGPGLWFVWPPRQICTDEPTGQNIWRNDNGKDWRYEPDRPSDFASDKLAAPEFGIPQDTLKWFDDHPASWGSYPDGRTTVILSDFMVAIDQSLVRFSFARSFSDHELGFYYAVYAANPPTQPASDWAATNCGPLASPDANERLWHYPTPDGRYWVGTFQIEPSGMQFSRLDELPPPILPTNSEVEAEKAEIAREEEIQGDFWPLFPDDTRSGGIR